MSHAEQNPKILRRCFLVMFVVAATLVVTVTPALGAQFEPGQLREEVHATRAAIEPALEPEGIPTEWQAEYAPAEGGHVPVEASPLWIVVNSGTATGDVIKLYIGTRNDASGNNIAYLRHLTPNATYYARFKAGIAEETVEFKTPEVGKPEIAHADNTIEGSSGSTFQGGATTSNLAKFRAQVETDGAATEYFFEVAALETGPFTVCASGSITLVEEFANLEATCAGLTPETLYFARLRATNEKPGSAEEILSFTTPTAKPVASMPEIRNVTATSAHLMGSFRPAGSETVWRLESAASQSGPWTLVPGAAGTVSQAEAEALPFSSGGVVVEGKLTGLNPSTTHYVRLSAENKCAVLCGSAISESVSFETSGPPGARTFATHALHGESVRLLGAVNPNSAPTLEEQSIVIGAAPTGGSFTLTFKGQTTALIAFDAPAAGPGSVQKALSTLPDAPEVFVSGPAGGPYTIWFYGNNDEGDQPQIEANASGLTPSGTVTVTTVQQGGEAYDTHYHFEYVSQERFSQTGWAEAESTPVEDLGSGSAFISVGHDLPVLKAGETYRYRILATNMSPGNPVVDGEEQTLTVPAATASNQGLAESCPNEETRTGPSANLPDCRAYEQLTPTDKEGAQELVHYGSGFSTAVLAGEDGEHVALEALATKWGSGPNAGQSPYFFSRAKDGWKMSAAASQPEFGLNDPAPQVFDANLTRFGFESRFGTFAVESKDLEYRTGSPGGPYTTIATVPSKQVGNNGGWVASSADFSKLVLAVEDRKLVEPPTTTKTGLDLYEYVGGELHQVNAGIGTCGASIARGEEQAGALSSAHSLSADGSRVFFQAVPGNNCSAPAHLYIRVNGSETLDLGAVSFLAANESGNEVLLEKINGETHEVLLYDTDTAVTTHLFTARSVLREAHELRVSAGSKITGMYLATAEQLIPQAPAVPGGSIAQDIYRYDISAGKLYFLVQATRSPNANSTSLIESVSPDGRYAYFGAETVFGLPGGAKQLHANGTEGPDLSAQVYRYDSLENAVECVSCASPADPEPRLLSVLNSLETKPNYNGGLPTYTAVSANGDYAFFSTPAALIPQDVDGEIVLEEGGTATPTEHASADTSPSSDVYEWRRFGVNGCLHVQGCLALITNGRGGYLNLLLGTANEGRDVFIYTSSQLLPQDNDTAGDIYDVRIGGGFPPPPPRPTECEANACSTPFAAPNDLSPSSSTFHGAGNTRVNQPEVKGKHKPTHKCKAKGKRKCKVKVKPRKAGKNVKRAGIKQGRRP